MYLGKNIRYLRRKKGLGQDDLAKLFNYRSYTTIQKWESGASEPSAGIAQKLASFFNVSMDDLVNIDLSIEKSMLGFFEYPFFSEPIAAGIPTTVEGVEELPLIPIADVALGKFARNKDLIFMRVTGESMNKLIQNGSLIGVLRNVGIHDLNNGDVVVFHNEHDYSIKHYYKTDDKVIFRPFSTDTFFTDSVYSTEDDVCIIGKVVMYCINLD